MQNQCMEVYPLHWVLEIGLGIGRLDLQKSHHGEDLS